MNTFKMLFAAAAVLFALLSGSDAYASDETFKATYIRANLVKGKTTTDQVLAKFGEPTNQTMDDSSETWVYQRTAASAAKQKKRGGGLGAIMGVVKGVAETAYEIAPEAGEAASRLYSGANRVERASNAAERIGGGMGAADESAGGSSGPSALEIRFKNGVVSGFSLR